MRTARSLTVSHGIQWGGVCPTSPGCRPPQPWMQTTTRLYADPHHPVDRITDTCENITLPQTSFAGGKKLMK